MSVYNLTGNKFLLWSFAKCIYTYLMPLLYCSFISGPDISESFAPDPGMKFVNHIRRYKYYRNELGKLRLTPVRPSNDYKSECLWGEDRTYDSEQHDRPTFAASMRFLLSSEQKSSAGIKGQGAESSAGIKGQGTESSAGIKAQIDCRTIPKNSAWS